MRLEVLWLVLPLNAKCTSGPSQSVACNILVKADLSHVMGEREAQMHTIGKQVDPYALSPLPRGELGG